MSLYTYKGKSLDGIIIKGEYEAINLQELIEYMHIRDYYLLSFKCKSNNKRFILSKKISNRDLSLLCKQFHTIINSGISIIEAISILTFQSISCNIKENMNFIMNEIRKGENLSKSMEKTSIPFPYFFIKMVRVGEESGSLDEVFMELYIYYDKEYKIMKKVKSAMLYPIIVFIVTILSSMVLMVTVIPSLTSVLTSLGGKIPPLTKFIMGSSRFLQKNWMLILSITVLMICTLILYMAKLEKHPFVYKALLSMPIIGKTYKKTLEVKICRSMAILIRSGVNIVNSLEITSQICSNSLISLKMNSIIREVREGKSISDSMIYSDFFDPLIVSMTKIGEETGRLDDMFHKITEVLEEDVEISIGRLTELIQPVMLLTLSLLVGSIIFAVVLPMFSLYTAV